MNSSRTFALRLSVLTTTAFVLFSIASQAQDAARPASPPADASVRELGSQVRELRAIVEEMRAENAQSRAEMRQLRQELQDTRKLLGSNHSSDRLILRRQLKQRYPKQVLQHLPPSPRLSPRHQHLRNWETAFRNSKNPHSCWARKLTSNIKPKWKLPPSTARGFPGLF